MAYHDSIWSASCFSSFTAWCFTEFLITILGLSTMMLCCWLLYRMFKYQNESMTNLRSLIIYVAIALSFLTTIHALFFDGAILSLTAAYVVSVECSFITVFFLKIGFRTNTKNISTYFSISYEMEKCVQNVILVVLNVLELALYVWSLLVYNIHSLSCHSPPFMIFSIVDVTQIFITIIAVWFIFRRLQKQYSTTTNVYAHGHHKHNEHSHPHNHKSVSASAQQQIQQMHDERKRRNSPMFNHTHAHGHTHMNTSINSAVHTADVLNADVNSFHRRSPNPSALNQSASGVQSSFSRSPFLKQYGNNSNSSGDGSVLYMNEQQQQLHLQQQQQRWPQQQKNRAKSNVNVIVDKLLPTLSLANSSSYNRITTSPMVYHSSIQEGRASMNVGANANVNKSPSLMSMMATPSPTHTTAENFALNKLQMIHKSHQMLILIAFIFFGAIVTCVYETWNFMEISDCDRFFEGNEILNESLRFVTRVTWLFIPTWLTSYVFWMWPKTPVKYNSQHRRNKKHKKQRGYFHSIRKKMSRFKKRKKRKRNHKKRAQLKASDNNSRIIITDSNTIRIINEERSNKVQNNININLHNNDDMMIDSTNIHAHTSTVDTHSSKARNDISMDVLENIDNQGNNGDNGDQLDEQTPSSTADSHSDINRNYKQLLDDTAASDDANNANVNANVNVARQRQRIEEEATEKGTPDTEYGHPIRLRGAISNPTSNSNSNAFLLGIKEQALYNPNNDYDNNHNNHSGGPMVVYDDNTNVDATPLVMAFDDLMITLPMPMTAMTKSNRSISCSSSSSSSSSPSAFSTNNSSDNELTSNFSTDDDSNHSNNTNTHTNADEQHLSTERANTSTSNNNHHRVRRRRTDDNDLLLLDSDIYDLTLNPALV